MKLPPPPASRPRPSAPPPPPPPSPPSSARLIGRAFAALLGSVLPAVWFFVAILADKGPGSAPLVVGWLAMVALGIFLLARRRYVEFAIPLVLASAGGLMLLAACTAMIRVMV